jgi:undecaprenyl phosphate N,N'-diacetylbacillosamine 1-phosphate transferase
LLLIIACLVVAKLGRPVLFKQVRPGKDEKLFTLYKFRTMTDMAGMDGKLLTDDERLNSFGRKLRGTSLDELPELINILKGDMSFVGPRPLLERYLERYSFEQKRRHEVRPGLTGLAQVNGRNAISWKQKFDYDIYYIENLSFSLDLKIVLKTVAVVFSKDGISVEGDPANGEFMGQMDNE